MVSTKTHMSAAGTTGKTPVSRLDHTADHDSQVTLGVVSSGAFSRIVLFPTWRPPPLFASASRVLLGLEDGALIERQASKCGAFACVRFSPFGWLVVVDDDHLGRLGP